MLCSRHHNPPGGSSSSCSNYGNYVRILVLFWIKEGLFHHFFGYPLLFYNLLIFFLLSCCSWKLGCDGATQLPGHMKATDTANGQCPKGAQGPGRPLSRDGCSYSSSWRPIIRLLSVGLWVGEELQSPALRLAFISTAILLKDYGCLFCHSCGWLRSPLTAWWQDEPRWLCQVFCPPQGSCSIPGSKGASESYIFLSDLPSLTSWYAIVCLSHRIYLFFTDWHS